MRWWKLSSVCSLLPVVNKVQGSSSRLKRQGAFGLVQVKGTIFVGKPSFMAVFWLFWRESGPFALRQTVISVRERLISL
jgi:hypothetical protein